MLQRARVVWKRNLCLINFERNSAEIRQNSDWHCQVCHTDLNVETADEQKKKKIVS
jgi:hypothetical protein